MMEYRKLSRLSNLYKVSTVNELDKWSAEQCGVELGRVDDYEKPVWFYPDDKYTYEDGEWTLSDSRCMQVFRERFNITTMYVCPWHSYRESEKGRVVHHGKTILEAELACAQAIYEASK